MFVVIIPIFLLILTLVYDVGMGIYEKNRMANTCYLTVQYGLDNITSVKDSDLVNLVMENTDNVSLVEVLINNNEIEIKASKKIRGILGKMFNFDLIYVNCYYKGSIIDGEKKIERIV